MAAGRRAAALLLLLLLAAAAASSAGAMETGAGLRKRRDAAEARRDGPAARFEAAPSAAAALGLSAAAGTGGFGRLGGSLGEQVASAVGDVVLSAADPRHLERRAAAGRGAARNARKRRVSAAADDPDAAPAVGFVRNTPYNVTGGQTLRVELRCEGCGAAGSPRVEVGVEAAALAEAGDNAVQGVDYLLAQARLVWEAGEEGGGTRALPVVLLPRTTPVRRRLTVRLTDLGGAGLLGAASLPVYVRPGSFCETGAFVNATRGNVTRRVCWCPADRRGALCDAPVPPECEARLATEGAEACAAAAPGGPLDARYGYDRDLDGEPPCLEVPGAGTLRLRYEVECRSPAGAAEGPDTAAQPWLLDEGFEWAAPAEPLEYAVLREEEPPLAVTDAADLPRLRLKFYNLRSLWADDSHAYEAQVTPRVVTALEDVLFEVPVAGMKEREFYPAGRLVSETSLPGAAPRPAALQHFEVSTFEEPPHAPAPLGFWAVLFIVLACGAALAVPPAVCLARRRRKRRRLERERAAAARGPRRRAPRRQQASEQTPPPAWSDDSDTDESDEAARYERAG